MYVILVLEGYYEGLNSVSIVTKLYKNEFRDYDVLKKVLKYMPPKLVLKVQEKWLQVLDSVKQIDMVLK